MTQITNINDLSKGDEVLFRDRKEPCTVVEEADHNRGDVWTKFRSVRLEGPRGAFIRIHQEDGKPNATGGGPIDNLRVVN